MRLVLFDEDFKLGVLKESNVVDVSRVTEGMTYFSKQEMMNFLIRDFDKFRPQIEDYSITNLPCKLNHFPINCSKINWNLFSKRFCE